MMAEVDADGFVGARDHHVEGAVGGRGAAAVDGDVDAEGDLPGGLDDGDDVGGRVLAGREVDDALAGEVDAGGRGLAGELGVLRGGGEDGGGGGAAAAPHA